MNDTLKIILNLATIFGMIFLFRFLGLKGILGLIIGLAMMAILLFSRHPMLMFFVKLLQKDEETINGVEKAFRKD